MKQKGRKNGTIETGYRKNITGRAAGLIAMADQIHGYKEISYQEYRSAKLIETYLEQNGFQVETGVGGLPTAFRAVYEQGEKGPSIGLLCEYDALAGLGHGCAHHLQAPAILGAACAVKECLKDFPYRLVVYGTPGEETSGGKITMVKNGCFQDIDVALMVHGGDHTQVDVKSMALVTAHVAFHGVAAHAAIAPDKGRSALDAMILMFNGIEFLREHIKEDSGSIIRWMKSQAIKILYLLWQRHPWISDPIILCIWMDWWIG